MESTVGPEQRNAKVKLGNSTSPLKNIPPRSSAPTHFVLKSEKELENTAQQRGRKMSRNAEQPVIAPSMPTASMMGDSSFGVQSLEETINSAISSEENLLLSRTTSRNSEKSLNAADDAADVVDEGNTTIGRKRKAGNRVHPSILATGQRIISSERRAQAPTSPVSTSQSPLRLPTLRRGSNTSSIHMESTPLTSFRLSPHLESPSPSTARSGSPKSFRLSDEDSIDDTSSHVIMSSIGDEEDHQLELPPQLVMPSLSVPPRRPFTEQGRRIRRATILVLGPRGVGKTSFIHSLYRSEHIVHMEALLNNRPQSSTSTTASERTSTDGFTEVHASTRPFPSWWTDIESQSTALRRSSLGGGILERNLTFVDTPGLDDDDQVHKLMNHLKMTLRRTANMDSMNDSEVVALLSGDGGVQIDAAIYIFDPTPSENSDSLQLEYSAAHQELLQCLSKWTNLIPIISRSDLVTPEMLELRKLEVSHLLKSIGAVPYRLLGSASNLAGPLAVSFAQAEDAEIDASVLMASQYLSPLVSSELSTLTQSLLDPENIAKMRHFSATKFLRWRLEDSRNYVGLLNQAMDQSPYLRPQSPGVASSGSILDEPSKVLVPHSSSSYYRSASPATSDISGNNALAHFAQQAYPSEPFRQVRLTKWAEDLRRSLANESRKYAQIYNIRRPSKSDQSSDDKSMALVRPGRGRLGGDLGVIDPRDPLGVLALGSRGFVIMKVVGGCGAIGAIAYWIMKNWVDVQQFLAWQSPSSSHTIITNTSHPSYSVTKLPILGWLDEQFLRDFFGWR